MRSRVAVLLVLAALAGACKRDVAPSVKPSATVSQAPAVDLLDLERGASVVSRTGEYYYERSAAHAIDGDVGYVTHWISPPDGPEQTFVVGLAARSRIRRVGLVTMSKNATPRVRVEWSLDAASWTPVGTYSFDIESHAPQIHEVSPFEARYLRLHTVAPGQTFAVVGDFIAQGDELEPPHGRPIDGCWTINGRAARFQQSGRAVQGVIDPWERGQAIHIEGGFDGRAYRLMWRSGARIGDAMVTVAPDGSAVSGVTRHKNARTELPADGWLGARGPCATSAFDTASVRRRALEVVGRYPLYAPESAVALDFIASLGNARLVTRSSAAHLASLREALRARGVDVSKYTFVDRSSEPAPEPRFYDANIEIETK